MHGLDPADAKASLTTPNSVGRPARGKADRCRGDRHHAGAVRQADSLADDDAQRSSGHRSSDAAGLQDEGLLATGGAHVAAGAVAGAVALRPSLGHLGPLTH